MSSVFVSYKRENETLVAPLVHALTGAGFTVWWDRGLTGGENWRVEIQAALERAGCVIVVWTRESVGPAGDFVREEAAQAKQRGVLVPVLRDSVTPPLGFGEIQAVDLTRWNGKPRDPFFEDLCAAVIAKLNGLPTPPARGPIKRLVRQMTYGSLASMLGTAALLAALNVAGVQDLVCGGFALQPYLSDTCGRLGLGHRPTQAERIAWEGRARGDCDALRAHLKRFPGGAYRDVAADILAARRTTQTERWTSSERRLALFVGSDDAASPNRRAAEAAALIRAQPLADRLCQGFATTTGFRFTSAKPAPESWSCSAVHGGVICGFDGTVVCVLQESSAQEHETCGP